MKLGYTIVYVPSVEASAMNFSNGYVRASDSAKPLGVEIALVTADVQTAHKSAIDNGATQLASPAQKPWGQTVSYVRTPDGMLVELCTPVHN
jgi:lactoylglutathione lyase